MYDYFFGKITYLDENQLTLECGSVGYSIFLASSSLSDLLLTHQGKKGELLQSDELSQRIYVFPYYSENRKRDCLYGFLFKIERELFHLLLGVSGVGPRLAAKIMLSFSAQSLLRRLMVGDSSGLKGVKGLGERTAEKMIIELKKKAKDLYESPLAKDWDKGDKKELMSGEIYDQTREAMLNLGYRPKEVDKVLREMTADQSFDNVEDMIKMALVRISQ